MIYSPDPKHIEHAARILRQGGIVVFPTETVYGLGANALDDTAVAKIYSIKQRPATNPLIVHIADADHLGSTMALDALKIPQEALHALRAFWPGPLTLVGPAMPSVSRMVTAGKSSVAVRVPSHPVAHQLLEACEVPLAAPSANPSTRLSPTTALQVEETLGDKVDLILDGGPCGVGVESTILSLLEWPPRLLRPGGITAETLEAVLGVKIALPLHTHAPDSEAMLAPGMMREHYSPETPLVFLDRMPQMPEGARIGMLAFNPESGSTQRWTVRKVLSERGDLTEVARTLFTALYEMDKLRLDLIVVDSCPEEGIGRAIMDRLRRAVARFFTDSKED